LFFEKRSCSVAEAVLRVLLLLPYPSLLGLKAFSLLLPPPPFFFAQLCIEFSALAYSYTDENLFATSKSILWHTLALSNSFRDMRSLPTCLLPAEVEQVLIP
jgi:hypothetical protein